MALPPNYRGARLRTVLEVTTLEGCGTEGNVYREVTRFIDPETGETLATRDDWLDEQRTTTPTQQET